MMDLFLDDTIIRALREDIGHGDLTSLLVIPDNLTATAYFLAKQNFVLAGMPFVHEVFRILDPGIRLSVFYEEGSRIDQGTRVAVISGKARAMLMAERVALNILQHISGIATLTAAFADAVRDFPVRIVETRKTLPGLRYLEKYAVRIGGGHNHRYGLSDGILIKDNHIDISGGISEAVRRARAAHHLLKIEVEVRNIDELEEAISAGADVVMLDNMTIEEMKRAVAFAKGRVIIEASGSVSLSSVRSIAETGVDIISIGALTHSAPAADISMKIDTGSPQ